MTDTKDNHDTSNKRQRVEMEPEEDDSTSDDAFLAMSQWNRAPLDAKRQSNEQALAFQWMDITQYEGSPLAINPSTRPNEKPIPGATSGNCPIIRFYGVTAAGASVCCHVHGFSPYFYAATPPNFDPANCPVVKNALGNSMGNTASVLFVKMVTDRTSLYGYQFNKKLSLFKIYVALPQFIAKARSVFENGFFIPGYDNTTYTTYESNVAYDLRFMIDNDISGCNWLECPAESYGVRAPALKTSSCQLEVDIVYHNLISHKPEGPVWGSLAPLRILSFDIECKGRYGFFPEASRDPVIQIANVVQLQGSDRPFVSNVFVLKGCKNIVGAHVMSFDNEGDMLQAWAAFVRQVDPDLITGYNTDQFDVPYLMDRAKALQLPRSFNVWGRLVDTPNVQEKKSFSSAAYGKTEGIRTTIHGRVNFDLLPILRRNHQLSSYSLNAVSWHFLNQQKEDVPHGIISTLFDGSDEDRHRLAVYCLKDALLPVRLMTNLSCLVNYVEMARVTGVPLLYLTERGQQIKVFSMILRKCPSAGYVVPTFKKAYGDDKYEGATVIEPKKAYYTVPIATLDFASLYPSIMQAYNLCFSTLVSPSEASQLAPDAMATSPAGDIFVTAPTLKGILPQILEELLSARKRAKADMKAATDPAVKAVQNGRQLALKVSANSVYGFTGAAVGQLPCIPIASSTTAYGRLLLEKTKSEVERIFTIDNGYAANADVVYGDTDSVMVRFGVSTVAESMPLAIEAANLVSAIFPSPIKLEFEKVYYPYLLMNKKRYAGLLWTNAESYDKLDSKGLETVRRDNCLLVRKCVATVLEKVLIDKDVNGALDYTKGLIADLLQNKTDLSLLVITKALNKTGLGEDYKVKQAHIELFMRMKKRDAGSAPVLGDRIAYVVIDKGPKVKMYDKAEDPIYALENNIPLDSDYYLNNQLKKPLERIFEPIIGPGRVQSEIFHGDHTLKRSKPVVKGQAKSGMMKFIVKKERCLSCKTVLQTGKGGLESTPALCPDCLPHESAVYLKHLDVVNDLSLVYNKCWTECQTCQGSMLQEVLCTSRDCPIFYKRIKVQKDLTAATTTLSRFEF